MKKYNLWTQIYNLNQRGKPFQLSKGQEKIFEYVYEPKYRRVVIKAATQYGKSDVTSLAIIHSAIDRKEKILIVSPSIKQSQIIMGYVITHFFDHPHLKAMLEIDQPLERLQRERSKQRLTLKTGSEIAILTADARTVSQEAKGLMGFGANTVIVDESGLIPDEMYGKVLRMIGGTQGKLVQLGNPFPSKHFENAFTNKRYQPLTIDYKQAIEEGRLTEEFVEEARETITPFDFEVFYECNFPQDAGQVFRNYKEVMISRPSKPIKGRLYVMGVDLARVEDYTVITVFDRSTNSQVYQERFNQLDWNFQKSKIGSLSKYYNDAIVILDASGVGDPIAEDLIREQIAVVPFKITSASKKEIIEKFVIWIEQHKLRLLNLPETALELNKFHYSITGSGYTKYEARQGFNDDIVIANALAVWELQPEIRYKKPPKKTLLQQYYERQTQPKRSTDYIEI